MCVYVLEFQQFSQHGYKHNGSVGKLLVFIAMAFVYQLVFSVIYTGTSIRDLFHVSECMLILLKKHGELLLSKKERIEGKKNIQKTGKRGALLFHFNLHIEFKAHRTHLYYKVYIQQ